MSSIFFSSGRVTFTENRANTAIADGHIPRARSAMMQELLDKVIVSNPMWRFSVIDASTFGIRDNVIVNCVQVYCDGELIGQITASVRADKAGVALRNHRILIGRRTRSDLFTSDVNKALNVVKKFFVQDGVADKVEKFKALAERKLGRAQAAKRDQTQSARHEVSQLAMEYVRKVVPEQFVAHMHSANNMQGLATLSKFHVLEVEMATVQGVYDAAAKGRTALIIVDGKKYIVKTGDNVQLYDDNTLPEELRGKLGMLKLVEEDQVVTGIGMRVSVEAFTVVTEAPTPT
jgi:hypothetical protein